ncbi:MAG: hypothetical protein AB1499_16290 [Nitrospirota bacterium]
MSEYKKKIWSFKSRAIVFALLLAVILNAHYYSDFQTTLLPGEYIRDGSSDLTAGLWSVPVVYDWDDDGKKDLLVGGSYTGKNGASYGHVDFYKNTGTDSTPSFNGHTLIQTCADVCLPVNAAAFG